MPLTARIRNQQNRWTRGVGNIATRVNAALLAHPLATKILLLTMAGQLALFAALAFHNGTLIGISLEEPFKLRVESMKPLLNSALAPLLVERDYAGLARRIEDARGDDDIQYLVVRDDDDRIVAATGWNVS